MAYLFNYFWKKFRNESEIEHFDEKANLRLFFLIKYVNNTRSYQNITFLCTCIVGGISQNGCFKTFHLFFDFSKVKQNCTSKPINKVMMDKIISGSVKLWFNMC